MDYANLPGLAAAGMAGLIAGAGFGRKVSSNLMTMIEARLAAAEKQYANIGGGTSAAVASAAAEKYAAAFEKLAGAIEKHAAAIDDHGAATVAAAVEGHAAPEPARTR